MALTRAKVETWRRFYQQQNAEGLRRFLTDDFIVIDAAGNVGTKSSQVAWLAKNAWSGPADFLYVIDRISFLGPDAAIVVGHGSGTRIGRRWRFLHRNLPFVECLSKGCWDMEAGHVTHLQLELYLAL